jgi:membrane-bound inhibitor of C-type lysozyme
VSNAAFMRRNLIPAAIFLMAGFAPASAQTFVSYSCGDGKPLAAAFFPDERGVRVQLDGKSLTLKRRVSASGARFSKSGVSFWIKDQSAMLKRRGQDWIECKAN